MLDTGFAMVFPIPTTIRRKPWLPVFARPWAMLLGATVLACLPLRNADAASDYAQVQTLTAAASGDGAPSGVFGYSVSIDGDMAVVADLGIATRPGRVRTYVREGTTWMHEENHDIEIYGDSSTNLALREGTLVMTGYDSNTGRGYLRILAHTPTGWDSQYGISSLNYYYESVATSGGIAVAGEPTYDGAAGQNQGRVWILRRDGADNWSSVYLEPTTPEAGARFGQSVSIVAGAIVVGAPRETVETYNDAGAAYIYELTIDTWNEAARLVETGGNLTSNRFGSAVAISGQDLSTPDRLLVSSPSNSSTGYAGRVRSYTRTNGAWTARTVLQAPSPSADDGWGCALALDNYWAAIGQCGSDAGASNGGAIEVVRFSPGFTSVDAVSIDTDPQAAADEHLGSRIDIDRDGPTVIVGNPVATMYGNTAQGVVLFGDWSDSTLTLTRELDLGQGLTGANFGWLAVDGDTLLVGANSEDVGLQLSRGAVYEYRRAPSGRFEFHSRILAPDGMEGDGFGLQLALEGDIALISASARTLGGIDDAGAVYVFHRESGVWSLEAQLLPAAPAIGTAFGVDIGFDGTTAMISTRLGETLVYERSTQGMWTPIQSITHQGWPLALSGDLALLADTGADGDIGEVAIYGRSGGSWLPQGEISGTDLAQGFGDDLSLDGDLLAVSSKADAAPVQIFRHGPSGWLPEASLLPEDVTPSTRCRRVALHAGELAMGCLMNGSAGAVYVFDKSDGSWAQRQKIEPDDAQPDDGFGFTLGYADGGTLLAGSPWTDLDFMDQGAVYAFTGDRLFSDGFESP
jgi:hypothetical protein